MEERPEEPTATFLMQPGSQYLKDGHIPLYTKEAGIIIYLGIIFEGVRQICKHRNRKSCWQEATFHMTLKSPLSASLKRDF